MARKKIEIKPYHGRVTASDILRVIAVFLLILVVISGGILIYGKSGGALPQLSLPEISFSWGGEERIEPTVDEPPVVEPQPAPEAEPEPTPEPEPEPEPQVLAAVEVSLDAAIGDALRATLAAKQANAIILDMKSDDGTLGFYTEQAVISAFPAVIDQTEEDTAALKTLLDGDIYTVARISAFKDNIVGNDVDYAILSNSGYRWTDEDYVHWSCPTREANRAYVLQCILEAAELGVDEIVLDNFGYPDRGQMGWIRNWEYYDRDNLSTVITEFLEEVSVALEVYPDLTLSVRVPSQVLDGTDDRIGLTVDALNRYADCIWIDAIDVDLYAKSGITVENAPVLVGDTLSVDGEGPSALLTEINF